MGHHTVYMPEDVFDDCLMNWENILQGNNDYLSVIKG